MSPFRRILEFAKPYRIYFVLSIVFNVLYSLMAIVSITSILPILKILFDNVKKEDLQPLDPNHEMSLFDELQHKATIYIADLMEVHGQLTVLAWLCAVTVVMFFFRNLFRYAAQYYMIALRSGTSRDIRNALYDKLLALPVSYFTDQRKGDIMTRISSDVDSVQRFTLMPIIEFFRAPIMIVATLAMLIFMNWKLTLAAFIILPVMGLVISTISKSLKNDTREAQKVLGNLISQVEETLSAAKIVKMFNAEKHLHTRFSDTNRNWRSLTNRVERKYELASPMSELLGSLTIIMLVWFGGKLVLEGGGLEGPAFILFLGLFFQLLDPAKALSKSFSDVSRGNASAERVFEVLDADIVVNQKPNATAIHSFERDITFKNVSFAYKPDHPVLKNFNLVINKGETVALVGQSGSGKTTVANLLTRFYDVTEGEILIDGTPIQDVKLDDYRALMGMVTQESVLFNDSIYNNITMGKEVTETAVHEAAMIANAHEFITQLPNGYYENIGESGGKLSGGQKQRLSIARAVLKNPPIMILDEATSALDTKSERLVQEALDNMMNNRTSLVIAHRLSTIQNADKIIVMDKGEIKEVGEHLSLIEQNGIYANLIRMQNFEG